MKIKKPDGTIAEVADDYVLLEGESKVEEGEGEAEAEKRFDAILERKMDKFLKAISDNPLRKVITTKEADLEKSVLQTDLYLRRKQPFIQLSKKMNDFVADMKMLARGGVPMTMQKALAEGGDTTGGFLVPEEFRAEVIMHATEVAIIRPRATVWPMSRDIMTVPTLDQSSDQFGGVALYWTAESALKVASNPTFGKITLNAKKLIGLCPVPDELLDDAAVNLANFLVTLFGEAIAYEEDKKFIQGTGMGEPLGIIKTVGIQVFARKTSSRIKIDDIIGMYKTLPAWADAGAVWLTSKAGLGQLLLIDIEATNKSLLWMPDLRGAPTLTLMGKPILLTEKVDTTIGNQGDIILGNLTYYAIGDRSGLAVTSSIHDRFRYDETTFRFVKRVDGQPSVASAFVVLTL